MAAIATRNWSRVLMALLLSAACGVLLLVVGPWPGSWLAFVGYTILCFTWFAPTLSTSQPAPLRSR
jgi:hypothetical protein